MIKIRNILCMIVMLFSSLFLFACKDNTPPSEVNVSFATLKTIVAESEEISGWKGLNITTLNANKEVVGSFKSTKQVVRTSDVIVDFIHEKGNHKIYCEDGVRYYYEDARKYLDESEFDYTAYEQELLSGCLDEVEEFFENDKNSENLLNSSKLDKEDNIEYTFEILLDKTTNKKLVATYICDKHNKLIMIKVSISSDIEEKVETEIEENDEIIVTPEWFDSNDYKTSMTYQEMREVVFAEDIFNGWYSAHVKDEIIQPLGFSGDDYEYNEFYLSKENLGSGYQNKLIQLLDDNKSFYIDGIEYIYKNNQPYAIENHDEISSAKLDFDNKLESLFYSYFKFMFDDGETMERYYTHSKKYEKDRTVISFRLFDDADSNPNIEQDEISFGSLYFDLEGNLYMVDLMMIAQITNYEEKHTTFIKLDEPIESPAWFNESDFEGL